MKTRDYGLLTLLFLLPIAVVAAGSGSVFAQSPCNVWVGSATATTQYYGSNSYGSYNPWDIQLTMPVFAGCPNYGAQLWAVGSVYDTVTNANLGSNNIAMNYNGGQYYSQLTFTLPSSVVQHLLQTTISVYGNYNNGQYGSLVGSTSLTVTIHGSNNYSTPTYPYYPSNYPYNSYYSGYPTYYYQNGYMYYYYPYSYYYSYPSYNIAGSCFNGQAIVYYNGAYYYVNCYQNYHRHH